MALFEFGCPDLDYVYDMSWAEFRIRQHGWNRKEKREWFKIREVAYAALIGSHIDPKKVPRKEQFMPLEDDKGGVTDKMKARMKQVIEEYKQQTNGESRITSKDRSSNNRPRESVSESN